MHPLLQQLAAGVGLCCGLLVLFALRVCATRVQVVTCRGACCVRSDAHDNMITGVDGRNFLRGCQHTSVYAGGAQWVLCWVMFCARGRTVCAASCCTRGVLVHA